VSCFYNLVAIHFSPSSISPLSSLIYYLQAFLALKDCVNTSPIALLFNRYYRSSSLNLIYVIFFHLSEKADLFSPFEIWELSTTYDFDLFRAIKCYVLHR
jgi:hypothetical protein